MAFCKECGNELGEEQGFCPECGAAVASALTVAGDEPTKAESAPSSPPVDPGVTAPPAPRSPQARDSAPRSRGRMKWVWIGGGAAVVVIAVVLVLVFTVFTGGGGPGASNPEQAVTNLLTAVENRDVEAVLASMAPDALPGLGDGSDALTNKEKLAATLLAFRDVKFEDLKMTTEMQGETSATVTITGGKLSVTNASGRTVTQNIGASGVNSVKVVKIDGRWYIAANPFS
jgi:hypothetical protein